MKKILCTLTALCLALTLAAGALGESLASLDYSVSEKLFKQLDAGSGFSGTLTVELIAREGFEAEAITTTVPWLFDVSYIFVPPDVGRATSGEKRYDVIFKEGDAERTRIALATRDGSAFIKSDLLGDAWYQFPQLASIALPEGTSPEGAAGASENPLAIPNGDALAQSPMPGLISFILPVLSSWQNPGSEDFGVAIAPYLTKIDLWIEAYRQTADLSKLADGTMTMAVHYQIPASALKAQIKQLLMDLLADTELTALLAAQLPKEHAAMLLNPAMQPYYFFAIDELPLEEDLTIFRTVSLDGETKALHLSLPFHDKDAGDVTLTYDRTAGADQDLPDENVLAFESTKQSMKLEYREYRSLTGVTVYQGTFLFAPSDASADLGAPKKLSAAFSLTHQTETTTDETKREALTHDVTLTIEPLFEQKAEDDDTAAVPLTDAEKAAYIQFAPIELALNAVFASKPEKNAATSLDFTFSFTSGDLPQSLSLSFAGKTRAKWTPEAANLSAAISPFDSMSVAEFTIFAMQAASKISDCFLPLLNLPAAPESEPTSEPTSTFVSPPKETPEKTATEAPTATPAPKTERPIAPAVYEQPTVTTAPPPPPSATPNS